MEVEGNKDIHVFVAIQKEIMKGVLGILLAGLEILDRCQALRDCNPFILFFLEVWIVLFSKVIS